MKRLQSAPCHRWPVGPAALLWLLLAAPPAPTLGDDPLPDPLTVDQALGLGQGHPSQDSSLTLTTRFPPRHPLYLDCHSLAFGNAAADPGRGRPAWALLEAQPAERLSILERFFDVLLADLAFSRFEEAMAVAYVQFDRASHRRELGQLSDLRVLELESVYQQVLQDRAASEIARQLTRAMLAQALNRPDALPRNLVAPDLPTPPDPLPGVDALIAEAAARNPALASVATDRGKSDRTPLGLELRAQVLELLLRLRALAAAERRVDTESAYRDLKLDESRTLYEQEVAADLGYSMSQQTMTRMLEVRVDLCRTLAWVELNALAGAPVWPQTEGAQ